MKKTIYFILSFLLLFSLWACREMPTDDFDDFVEPDYSKTDAELSSEVKPESTVTSTEETSSTEETLSAKEPSTTEENSSSKDNSSIEKKQNFTSEAEIVASKSNILIYTLPDGSQLSVEEGTDITAYTMKNAAVSCKRKYSDIEEKILDLINEERKKENLTPLIFNEDAYFFTKTRAEECFESFSHTRPNGTGWDTVYTDANVLLNGCWGENLALGTGISLEEIAEEDVKGWMNSEGHRENIMNPDYKSVCIAVIYKDGEHTAVQNFFG